MSKHERTLAVIFASPTRANIEWRAIEALMVSLGAQRLERAGSRVAFALNGVVAVFHRPHPRKEAGKATVEGVRAFLETAGIHP